MVRGVYSKTPRSNDEISHPNGAAGYGDCQHLGVLATHSNTTPT